MDLTGYALLAHPVVHQGEASRDETLHRLVRDREASNVVLVGFGWTPGERFTIELSPDEFCENWIGD